MNEDNGQAQQPPGQPPLMEVNCSQCNTPMQVRAPAFRPFNYPDISGILFSHTHMDKCPECGTQYLCMLGGIDPSLRIMLAWTPVQTKESAIIAPTEQNMKKAVNTNQIASKIKLAN